LFWWVGLSFRYYNLSWMIIPVDLLIGVFYGMVFWLIHKVFLFLRKQNEILGKLFLVMFFTFGFDYIAPFTFDWLKPEILFVNTFFFVSKPVLLAVFLAVVFYRELRYASFFLLAAALFIKGNHIKMPDIDIYVAYTQVPQDVKWEKDYIPYEIENNFRIILKAIRHQKDAVVLPESAFPLFLNTDIDLMRKLLELSKRIVIITGALHVKNSKYYNATYVFENAKVKIIDKHILVPFGEYIPLPFFQKEINDLFFSGASDYATSSEFGMFSIKNYSFINAICYEATLEDVYELKPNYIVALSNDAWFVPSIMPSLQQMLIKIYALKHGKIVYHSINGFKSYIVTND